MLPQESGPDAAEHDLYPGIDLPGDPGNGNRKAAARGCPDRCVEYVPSQRQLEFSTKPVDKSVDNEP